MRNFSLVPPLLSCGSIIDLLPTAVKVSLSYLTSQRTDLDLYYRTQNIRPTTPRPPSSKSQSVLCLTWPDPPLLSRSPASWGMSCRRASRLLAPSQLKDINKTHLEYLIFYIFSLLKNLSYLNKYFCVIHCFDIRLEYKTTSSQPFSLLWNMN